MTDAKYIGARRSPSNDVRSGFGLHRQAPSGVYPPSESGNYSAVFPATSRNARNLADLLRTGLLSAVYHGDNGLRTLRELARSYWPSLKISRA